MVAHQLLVARRRLLMRC